MSFRGPFRQFKLDPPLLNLLAANDATSTCLKRALGEILAGKRELQKAAVGERIYWADACGYRLFMIVHPRASAIHFVGFDTPEGEP